MKSNFFYLVANICTRVQACLPPAKEKVPWLKRKSCKPCRLRCTAVSIVGMVYTHHSQLRFMKNEGIERGGPVLNRVMKNK